MPKAKTLSDPVIQELSIIFGTHKGEEWAPRNPGATVLGLKGAPAAPTAESTQKTLREGSSPNPSFLDKLVSAFKARSAKGWLVSDDAEDNVDGDGDASNDYETLVGLIGSVNSDLSSAMWMSDPDARSIAITTALDNFKKNLDDVYSGGDGTAAWKAGARHSKADAEHIDAMGAAADKMAKHASSMSKIADTMKGHVDALSTKKDDDKPKGDGDPDEGGDDDASKAAAKAASDAAALEQSQNAAQLAAKGGTVEPMTPEAIAAAFAPTLKAALDEQAATLKAEFASALTASTDALKADYDAKIAEATIATAETAEKAAAKAEEVDVLKASVNAIVGAVRAPRAPGGFTAMNREGRVDKAAAVGGGQDPALPTITPDMAPSTAIQTLLKAQTGALV